MTTPIFYVSESGDTDQYCLVEQGKNGGAVLDPYSIQKLLACRRLDLPTYVREGILTELVHLVASWMKADPEEDGEYSKRFHTILTELQFDLS